MPAPFSVLIPARYSSRRLPGKPLLDLAGEPLVCRVLANAYHAGADYVVVATDDRRIENAVNRAGGHSVLTSADHASGSDRLAEAVELLEWSDDTIVVNLQGDEPLLPGYILRQLATTLADHPSAGIATMATPVAHTSELFEPQTVKVVTNQYGYALYFSRAPIPWLRGQFDSRGAAGSLEDHVPFLRHLGLYAYRARTLRQLASLPCSAYERAESLEQLRALEAGIPVYVDILSESVPPGVDTPEDLEVVRRLFAAQPPPSRPGHFGPSHGPHNPR